uniref:Uncharacterized protein n=1 Tax=Physcomitrium patens TaxID=3218 RepID=A0A2K1J3W3_PHYPA|nr:hypothetical protein PHYPA_022076 [Physcomitrium patens]
MRRLKSQLVVKSENEERTSKIVVDANKELLSLNIALELVIEFKQELSKVVNDLHLEAKSLKATILVEGKMKELYVATKVEL